MNQGEQEGDYAYGSLTIAVRSSEARTFGKALTAATGRMDGELVSSSIEGEDLSKSIVDTEARLQARTVLRDRLMDVLRNRRGTVSELVAAERGLAQVNEEIDQARSWLTWGWLGAAQVLTGCGEGRGGDDTPLPSKDHSALRML